jgi:hypothetical protein
MSVPFAVTVAKGLPTVLLSILVVLKNTKEAVADTLAGLLSVNVLPLIALRVVPVKIKFVPETRLNDIPITSLAVEPEVTVIILLPIVALT